MKGIYIMNTKPEGMDKILNDLGQMVEWLHTKTMVEEIHVRQDTLQDLWTAVEALREVLHIVEEEEFEWEEF
jgi:hypothetical protein